MRIVSRLMVIGLLICLIVCFFTSSALALDAGSWEDHFDGQPGGETEATPTPAPENEVEDPTCGGSDQPSCQDPADPKKKEGNCNAGHPVSLFDGKFYLWQSDLAVPARLPIVIRRYYDAFSTFNGPFGYGWSMSYNERLFMDRDGNLVLRRENQKISSFNYQTATSDYRGESGDYDIITYDEPSDIYTLTEKYGLVKEFDTDGKLIELRDINDNQLLLTYDADGKLPINGRSEFSNLTSAIVIARDYRLLKIEEAHDDSTTGRFTEFSYNSDGRIIEIGFHSSPTSGAIRTYKYGYDGAGWGNLTDVEDPEGNHHSFDYEGHLMTKFSGPGCAECVEGTNEYDSQKRVTRQTLGPEGIATEIEIEYLDEHDRIVTTTVHDSLGNIVSTLTEEFYFDEDGNATIKIKKPGGGLDDVETLFSYNDSKQLIEEIDPRGTVTTYTYNAWGNLASETVQLEAGSTLAKSWTYDTDTHKPTSEEIALTGEGQTYRKEWEYYPEGHQWAGNLKKETQVMDGDNLVTEYEYNGYGDITEITDPKGIETDYSYDSYGLRTQKDEASGLRVTRYGYDSFGNQTEVTEAYGTALARTTYYTYNGLNRVTEIKHPTSPATYTIRTYDGTNLIEEETGNTGAAGSGRSTYYSYDAFNRQSAVQKETAAGTVTIVSYTRDSEGKKLSETDGNGNTTYYEYDGLGRLSLILRPEERETHYLYDANGNLIKRTDPLGNEVVYTYNNLNQKTEGKALGDDTDLIIRYIYTALGKVKSQSQKLGSSWITTSYDYDRAGRKIAEHRPESASSYYSFDKNGNWTGYTDAAGNNTVYGYDNLNRNTSRTNDLGITTEYTLDALGRRTVLTEAKNTDLERTTDYEYGNFDRITKITDDLNNETLLGYDLFGNMTSQTDANGNGTSYSYDYFNNKTSETNAEGHTTYYSYDVVGNWIELIDPNGNASTFSYSANNELISTTYPDFSAETNTYDDGGNRVSRITRAGEIITLEYDDFNRLIKKTYPDSSETTFAYDQLGRITDAENDYSTYEFTFNELGQLIEAEATLDSENYVVSYDWDKVGNKTLIVYPDEYYYYSRSYTALGSLDQVKDRSDNIIADYTYNDLNQRTRRDYLNSTWAAYTYNDVGRLTELGNWSSGTTAPISSFVYTLDNVGNRLTRTSTFGTQTYSYDKIYEVTGVDYPAGSSFSNMTYQYDACWNRQSTVNGGTIDYLTNSLNQYTSVGGISYEYDANGNLISDGSQTYYYDCENKLIKVSRRSDGQTLGEYKYDPFGKRIQKVAGGDTTNYVYDQTSYQVLEERDGSGILQRHFVYGAGIDEPLVLQQNSTYYYYCRDGLGSVINLTDSSGNTAKSYSYDVYGDFESSGDLSGNNYTFTGRRYDLESELLFYRARYYSFEIGRFFQIDPIGNVAGLNLFAYIANNSINGSDPTGNSPVLDPEGTAMLNEAIKPLIDEGEARGLKIRLSSLTYYCDPETTKTSGSTECQEGAYLQKGYINVGVTITSPPMSNKEENIDHEKRHVEQCLFWGVPPPAKPNPIPLCKDIACREVNAYALMCKDKPDYNSCLENHSSRSMNAAEDLPQICKDNAITYIREAIDAGCAEKKSWF